MSVTFTGTGSLVLPNPEFGDSEYNDQKNIVNRTRGGQVLVFPGGASFVSGGAARPVTRRISLTWRHLSKTEKAAVHAYLLNNLGTLQAVNDHRSETFNAIILTPDANITAEGREICDGDKGQRSVSLELEVVV